MFIKHLFFGSTSDFQQLAKQIPANASTVIIRMSRVPYMDQSGLYAMEEVLTGLVKSGKAVLIAGIKKQPDYMLGKIDIVPGRIPKDRVFDSFRDCLEWVRKNVQHNVG